MTRKKEKRGLSRTPRATVDEEMQCRTAAYERGLGMILGGGRTTGRAD